MTDRPSGTILVTGAAGFIGGHLAERFARAGRRVVALDLPGRARRAHGAPCLEAVEGDVADRASLERALAGVHADEVVHCAALMSGALDPAAYLRVNAGGTDNVASWAASRGASRFLHIGSVTVYGLPPGGAVDETHPFRSLGSPYPDSKIEAESRLRRHAEAGLPCTILRPGDVYGPRATEWVTKLVDRMRAGRMALVGGGRGLVNLTYVDNLADAVEAALEEPLAAGRDYLVTDGAPVTWKEYLQALAAAAGCPAPRRSVPAWAAGPAAALLEIAGRVTGVKPPLSRLGLRLMTSRCRYSIERARRELGWEPRVSFAEGMSRVALWLRRPD